jgi:biopolymer transport protein ExbB
MNGVVESFRLFMETGGAVLWLILLLSVLLWSLIIERFLFFYMTYPRLRRQWLDEWGERRDKKSWYARSIRDYMISQARMRLGATVPVIKTLIGLCPLLGLLGTVGGMIEVFDVMAVVGTGNPRAMASGVSQATINTMAGMVVAISGLFFSKKIEGQVEEEAHHLADLLIYE